MSVASISLARSREAMESAYRRGALPLPAGITEDAFLTSASRVFNRIADGESFGELLIDGVEKPVVVLAVKTWLNAPSRRS